jgi:vacuolar-type H+-ATPase subunit H
MEVPDERYRIATTPNGVPVPEPEPLLDTYVLDDVEAYVDAKGTGPGPFSLRLLATPPPSGGHTTDVREAPGAGGAYEGVARHVAEVLRRLDADVERLRTEADQGAARELAQAQDEADRIVAEARMRAKRIADETTSTASRMRAEAQAIVQDARREADRTLSELEERRRSILEDLQTTRAFVLQALEQLTAATGDGPEPRTQGT